MTSKRAKKSIEKINKDYPELLAKYCQDSLPCVTSKIDTVVKYDTTYTAIQFNYDSIPTDTIWLTHSRTQLIDKPVYIASVGKINTIIKTIKDSAQIKSCELELMAVNKKCNELTAQNTKLQNKVTAKNRWITWLIIALLCSIIVNLLLIKK
jgi:sensor histidine kinase regulating citrate/malate metabolism